MHSVRLMHDGAHEPKWDDDQVENEFPRLICVCKWLPQGTDQIDTRLWILMHVNACIHGYVDITLFQESQ